MSRKCTPLLERFWSRVDRQGPDDCWLWQGSLKDNGYGIIGSGGRGGKSIYVHRLSYDLAHPDDPLPDGWNACHTCDVRWADDTYKRCVNPAHLFAGTHQDNMDDMWAKGRGAIGERHGLVKHPERHAHGEAHHRAKLTDEKVIEIRRQLALGETDTALGREFGVDRKNIAAIRTGHTWRHLL